MYLCNVIVLHVKSPEKHHSKELSIAMPHKGNVARFALFYLDQISVTSKTKGKILHRISGIESGCDRLRSTKSGCLRDILKLF